MIKTLLKITGQVRGGKNNMGVTKTGRHYPKSTFKRWRDVAIFEVKQFNYKTIENPCRATIHYYAGDKRRRDVPAILDSIFHVLERAEVVKDDSLIEDVRFKKKYDKSNPQVLIILTEK